MSSRRNLFATKLQTLVRSERSGEPVTLKELYVAIARDMPELVDDEVEPNSTQLRWKHELRWELETLVVRHEITRRKDLGLGVYSV